MASLKGKFVRWTAKDAEGEFSHVGEVVGDSRTMMIINTERGEMLIDKSDGDVAVVRKPKNFKAGSKEPVAVKAPVKEPAAAKPAKKKAAAKRKAAPAKPKAKSAPRKGSLIGTAVEILGDLDRGAMSRQEMIAVLEDKMGIEDHKRASGLYQSAIRKLA